MCPDYADTPEDEWGSTEEHETFDDEPVRERDAKMSPADYLRRVDEELAAGRFASQSK